MILLPINLQTKIRTLFKNDKKTMELLLNCDPITIRNIGSISQERIDPQDVVDAFESNDQDTMNYLYNKAKRMLELHELYQELCNIYYETVTEEKRKSL